MGVRYIGAEVKRLEDPKLITGRGRYVDDIHLPAMLHAAFVRSSHAHAKIGDIDVAAAAAVPGVVAVLTAADFGPRMAAAMHALRLQPQTRLTPSSLTRAARRLDALPDTLQRLFRLIAASEEQTPAFAAPKPQAHPVARAFRHALLREGAYAALTDGDRRLGHRLAGGLRHGALGLGRRGVGRAVTHPPRRGLDRGAPGLGAGGGGGEAQGPSNRAARRALELRRQQDEAEACDPVARQFIEREVLDQVNPGLDQGVLMHRHRDATVRIWQHLDRHVVGADRDHALPGQPARRPRLDARLDAQRRRGREAAAFRDVRATGGRASGFLSWA